MNDNSFQIRPFLLPMFIGFMSLLGICMILALTWLSRQKAQSDTVILNTSTPFKFIFLATETPIATEPPPAEVPLEAMTEAPIATEPSFTEISSEFPVDETPATFEAGLCVPATAEYLDAVLSSVASMNPSNEVGSGWMVESADVFQLMFVATSIHGPEIEGESTPPGVWGIIMFDEGSYDIYAIEEVSQAFSDALAGEFFDPILTMQTDGAQTAYDCALNGQ